MQQMNAFATTRGETAMLPFAKLLLHSSLLLLMVLAFESLCVWCGIP